MAHSSSFSEDNDAALQEGASRLVPRPNSGNEGNDSDVASEVARFGAIKEKKHSLEAGIEIFNRQDLLCPTQCFTPRNSKGLSFKEIAMHGDV